MKVALETATIGGNRLEIVSIKYGSVMADSWAYVHVLNPNHKFTVQTMP
jgi:hypothetical protein